MKISMEILQKNTETVFDISKKETADDVAAMTS
jgi:hypothetical protein